MADNGPFLTQTFYVLTSQADVMRQQLEAKHWIFVSSSVVTDPNHPAPSGDTITALVMKLSMA